MTEQVMVAQRNATVQTPDGELYRLRAGQTYANPLHPAVVAYPSDWRALVVELSAPGPADAPVHDESLSTALDELREELAVAEEAAEEYRVQLVQIVDVLGAHGYHPAEQESGWLLRLLRHALTIPAPQPGTEPAAYVQPDKAESKAIREWAAANDFTVSDRGVLSRALVESYRDRGDG